MDIQSVQDARDRYHIAKLALFNIRLLARMQNLSDDSNSVRDIIDCEAKLNGIDETPSLLHQATFLQFSYVCLVWLWESAKTAGLEDDLLNEYPNTAILLNLSFPECHQIIGERRVNDWRSAIRLLRNALGHGRVKVNDNSFEFSDQNIHGKNREIAPTTLTVTWEQLGKISEAVIHSLTPVLWFEQADTSIG